MSARPNDLYIRKASLILVQGEKGLDLSELHFTFQTQQEDAESPANCSIRVHNLSETTALNIRKEYSRVVVQAGYESANFGVIFDGTIKQFRVGREADGVNTYLDILAADGDMGYNYAVCNKTLAAGSSAEERLAVAYAALEPFGIKRGYVPTDLSPTGGILPRGKVLFGLAKGMLRQQCQSVGATWSINNGRVDIIPLTGYIPGEAVVLTMFTGLVGRVEQTNDGMKARALINPKIAVGGLVKIDNKSINLTLQQDPSSAPLAYNQYAGIQALANVSADGLYRVYVAEFTGDTRGQDWYVDIVGLSIDPVTQQVKAYG